MIPRCFVPVLMYASVATCWSVCLDPGHGGTDTGAVGIYYTEKEANLDAAYLARSYMEQVSDITRLTMTRLTDVYVSLADRVAYANAGGYSRFISLHHNAFNGSVQGTETYCYTDGFPESFDLRDITHPYLVEAFGYTDRGVKTANFYVLRYTVMPSILGEASFIDYNFYWDESLRFQTHWEDHDGKEAWAYCAGLCQHMQSTDTPDYLSRVSDNSYPSFSMENEEQWGRSPLGNPFGRDYRYCTVSGNVETARWTPYIPSAGYYDVALWWVGGYNRADNVQFTVHHAGGESVLLVDQSACGEEWILLGTFEFLKGTDAWVEISSEGCQDGKRIIADAVRFCQSEGISGGETVLHPPTVYVTPNPGRSTFRIEVSGCGSISRLGIYDIAGRLVRTLSAEPLRERTIFFWNALDVEPGIYFAVADNGESGVVSEGIIQIHW